MKLKVNSIFFYILAIGIQLLIAQNIMAAQIFAWDCESSPVGNLSNGTAGQPFNDINNYDGVQIAISSDFAHSGTKSIRVSYPNDEAGVEFHVSNFGPSASLYTRKYEYYAPGWEGNWPVGLKTSRYFTASTPTTSGGYAYMSEKLIWQTYETSCRDNYGLGMNNAIYNLDLEDTYGANELFGNGLPYIRTGHWYKYETWMVLNSQTDAADGTLMVWIDDVLVYSNTRVVWKSSSRGCPNGTGWQNMWFGGNYSGAICGGPTQTVHRYIDDLYLSTTLDRSGDTSGDGDDGSGDELQVPGVPSGLTILQD